MARMIRRLHYRRGNRKLHPLAIVGICLGGAILLALLIGNLLNLWLDDEKMAELKGNQPTESTDQPSPELPSRAVAEIRAYPFALGDEVESLIPEEGQAPQAVSISINTPDGKMLYRSAVSQRLYPENDSEIDLKAEMSELVASVSYVCGVFYPNLPVTDDIDLIYAMAATDASLLREFVSAGGSEILLAGVALDSDALPCLGDYLKQLQVFLGDTPVGLSVPWEAASAEDSWELLTTVAPLADFLAVDLQAVSEDHMEAALKTADYYVRQYKMRLVISSAQARWVSAVEVAFSDYQIVASPPQESNAQS